MEKMVIEKIRDMRRNKGMSIISIRTEMGMTNDAVVHALLPDNYKKHDLVECECCGKLFDPHPKNHYSLSCSKECAKQIDAYYKRLKTNPNAIHPREWTTEENWSHEDITCVNRNGHYDPFLDMVIYDEPESQKRIKREVKAADEERISYGKYIRNDEQRRANKAGVELTIFIKKEFYDWCDSCRREKFEVE